MPFHDSPGVRADSRYSSHKARRARCAGRACIAGRTCGFTLSASLLVVTLLLALTSSPAVAGPVVQTRAEPAAQTGPEGEALFQARCVGCHTIGQGRLVGPDLQGVSGRRDPAWLKSFIADPSRLFAANDPTAQQLLKDSNGVKMPTLGLSPAQVDALLAYLAGPGSASGAAPAAAAPAAPSTAGDPAVGQLLFTGSRPLMAGGPACLACHSV